MTGKSEFQESLDVLSLSLNGPQLHILNYIVKRLFNQIDQMESDNKKAFRKIEELQKELAFKGVPDDGC